MKTVYLETTFVGHLTGRIHHNPVVAARQISTRHWWITTRLKYRPFISQLVLDECANGDPNASIERLEAIAKIDVLDANLMIDQLAKALVMNNAVPATEPRDAFHIAIAAAHGIHYLLKWNFKHIANATLRQKIEDVCRYNGFEPPIIATPDELMEQDNDT